VRKLLVALAHRSVRGLLRVAAILALLGLAIMSLSVVWPRPIVVVLAMSVGHGIGAGAVACYVLAILLTMRRTPPLPPEASSLPPAADAAASSPSGPAPPSVSQLTGPVASQP
jgi:hypothetical protein